MLGADNAKHTAEVSAIVQREMKGGRKEEPTGGRQAEN